MEHASDYGTRRSGSFHRTSSADSSLRRLSLSLSGAVPFRTDDDIESETSSQAGDIGDRALHSNRYSGHGSFRLSVDNVVNNGVVVPIKEDSSFPSHGFRDPKTLNTDSSLSPCPAEMISPLSTDAIMWSADKTKDSVKVWPRSLEYISSLTHLAVFGILGVLTRYLLQKLFGPGVVGATSDQSILYLDLPSNMVGSFLMGWWGVVFKADISRLSDYLAIGMTTGYLGSLTTFSGWNQKMLDLCVGGQWVLSLLGFLIGLFLAAFSIIFGVQTAKGFKWLLRTRSGRSDSGTCWRVDSCRRHIGVIVVLMLILGLLWGLSGILLRKEFGSSSSEAQLWLACIVAPLGVWIRWFLARFNGRGLGRSGMLKWLPFGTLIANVSAACIMAALSTTKKAVNTKTCDTIATGIQFGLLGCLSTVSTFIAEFHAMSESKHPWRAYAYAALTIGVSFGLGIMIYFVPVRIKGYS